MKKQLLNMVAFVIMVLTLTFCISNSSYAYTEEEKQQAKAWLSAHGYSPDMGGASQAYADYLNGKFDEELGVDVNGDGIPAAPGSTKAESTENGNKEQTDRDEGNTSEEEGKPKRKLPGNSGSDGSVAANVESDDTQKDSMVEAQEGAKEIIVESRKIDSDLNKDKNNQEKVKVSAPAKPEKLSRGLITPYKKSQMDTYKEAIVVIGISLLLTMVLYMLFSLRK